MTASSLVGEFTGLKEELQKFTSLIEVLIQKYSKLEKKYEKSLERRRKAAFKCKMCDEEVESIKDLKKHRESCKGTFECEDCDKCFKDEVSLENHVKRVHRKFECDECDNVYEYEGNLEKHMEAVHEDVVLFCHYYNNNKECPYDNECIFAHEESEQCKFGKACDRVMCMYRHVKENDEESDEDEANDVDNDDDNDVNPDDIAPCLENIKKSLEKVAILLKEVVPILKCEDCGFEAKNQNGLTMHVKAKHPQTKAN